MDIARLQIFRDVAQLGSIAAAARRAGCDPSAVSRSLAALEAELGLRLIQRSTRRLELTEAGESYLRRIEPIIDELAAARDEALSLVKRPQGRLRISASTSYGQAVIPPLLQSFRRDFPDVQVELILTDVVSDLVADRIDVALRMGPQPTGDLIVSLLTPTTMRVVASPEYLRSAPAIRSPRDLANHACLISVARSQTTWMFRRAGKAEDVSVIGQVSTSNTLAVRRCVLDNMGIAVLASWLVDDDIAAGRLTSLLPGWRSAAGDFETGVWIVYPSRSFLPLKTRAFIDHLRQHVRSGRRDTRGEQDD